MIKNHSLAAAPVDFASAYSPSHPRWWATWFLIGFVSVWLGTTVGMAQDAAQTEELAEGYLIEIPNPLLSRDVDQILAQLTRLSQAARDSSTPDAGADRRISVVLHFGADATASLEDSLKLARAISGTDLKRIRPIAWVDSPVRGSEVLLVLACESILASPTGSIGDATFGENANDETTSLIFQSIAARRSLLAPEIVTALANPNVVVARVRLNDGTMLFAVGEQLETLRREGSIVEENILSPTGQPLVLTADQMREFRAATAIVNSKEDVADRLGLAKLRSEAVDATGQAIGVLLRISGPVRKERIRRWQSNLAATIEAGETNTWLIEIDSPGGYLAGSAALAATLADPGTSIRSVGGYVLREARGDASLIALACRPLVMHPDATLGGIAEVCRTDDLWLISDEVYDTQVWEGRHLSPRALPGMAERTLVVGSMSKSHAMTGSRCGWIVGPEAVIAHLVTLATHTTYGVPGFIQDASLFALSQGRDFEAEIAAPFRRRRAIAQRVLGGQNTVGLIPAQGAMYLMLDIRATGMTGEAFAYDLLEHEHIAVMPGESFGAAAAGHLRVAMTIAYDAFENALRRLCAHAEKHAAR